MDSNWVFFRAKNSRGGVKLEFVRNSFDSKIDNSVDSKRQKKFKKFDNFQFEIRSIRFDSTPTVNWLNLNDKVEYY